MHRSCLLLLLLLSLTARVLGAGPSVERVVPAVGQRGTVFPIHLTGAGLASAQELRFYRPGLVCQRLEAKSENELTATIEAAADCSLGSAPFRVRTPQGWSELFILRMSPFPVIPEVESDEAVQPVAGPVTITGTLPESDVDRFRMTLKRGERCSAEVEGVRLGAGLTDTRLRVIAPDGQTLLEVDDTPLFAQDPLLSFVAASDGDYVVEVSSSGRSDDNSLYALHLGVFPRPRLVYPAGGPAGQTLELTWLGDAAGTWTESRTLPAATVDCAGLFATRDGQSAPTANPFRIVDFENVLEVEPNNSTPAAELTAVNFPRAFNGFLAAPGDVDQFGFTVERGELIRLSAFGNRIGSAADLELSILNAAGRVLARNDDHEGLDSGLLWRCPEAGTYRVQVRDQRGGGGPEFLYRIEGERVTPGVTAFLPRRNRQSQERQTVSVPQGNRVVALMAVRRDGWSGPATLQFPGLPDGLTVQSGALQARQFLVPVQFESAASLPSSGILLPVQVAGVTPAASVHGGFEQVVDLVASSADRLYTGIKIRELAVAVTEPVPYRLRLQTLETGLPRDGTLAVTVLVDRDPGFTGSMDVTFPYLPQWVTGPDKITIGPDQTSAEYLLSADRQVAIGDWPLYAEARPGLATARDADTNAAPGVSSFRRRGRSSGPRIDQIVATPIVPLQILETPVTGQIGDLITEAGQSLEVRIPMDVSGAAPEQLLARLDGLPNRIVAEPVTIRSDAREIVLKVQVAEDAPLGVFAGLSCHLSGQIRGQAVSYVIGRGATLKIVPRGELVTDETGRPLSPLEKLRRQPAVQPGR